MSASTDVSLADTSPSDPQATRTAQVAALTGLRGFAALMVLLVHVSGLTAYAWLGLPSYGPVSLFVLSGYLLYRPWARWGLQAGERPSLAVFARRRLARIFPAYLVVVGCVALVYPVARPETGRDWFSLLTLTWIYGDQYLPATFAQTWSLAVELAWYVALPLLATVTTALARSRTPRTGFWITCAMLALSLPVVVAWRLWVPTDDSYVPHALWLPGYLACFAVGALIAHVVQARRAGVVEANRLRAWADDRWALPLVALAAALLATSALGGPAGFTDTYAQEQLRVACATVVALALLLGAALGRPDTPLNTVLGARWSVAIGRWSYGLFLWHFPVLVMLEDLFDHPAGLAGFVTRFGLTLAISLPLSAATYAWVERPAIAWSQRSPQSTRDLARERDSSRPAEPASSTTTQAAAPTADQVRSDSAGS